MALVIICGHPSSGKSTIARKLMEAFKAEGILTNLIDDPSLHLDKNVTFKNHANEKNARSKLRSTVDRTTNKNTITIVDSLNSIKGYRYELWCIARSVGVRYCMVHVDTSVQQAKEWNSERLLEAYEVEIFEDLTGRFERPDSRNRWDAPLFTIRPGSEDEDESFEAIVAAITRPDTVQGPAAKELKPTLATQNPSLSGTNLLFEIDSAAQEVVVAVQDAQSQCLGADSNSGVTISFPDCNAILALSRPFPVAELRRLKRAFLKLATKVTFARIQDRMTAKKLFIDYLRSSSTESVGDEMMGGSY